MGMGFAPTWLCQVSPPASQNHFNHWLVVTIWLELCTTYSSSCHHHLHRP